jgi:hypothetical protein
MVFQRFLGLVGCQGIHRKRQGGQSMFHVILGVELQKMKL